MVRVPNQYPSCACVCKVFLYAEWLYSTVAQGLGGVIYCSLEVKRQLKAVKLEGPELCSTLLPQSRVAASFCLSAGICFL